MSQDPGSLRTGRGDGPTGILVFVLALAFEVAISIAGIRENRIALPQLAVFFDGHLYLEIARSFPLPYAAEGLAYQGHAPAYPALVALLRGISGSFASWGVAGLLGAWLPAALSASVFYGIAKKLAPAPLGATFLFIAANPRWVMLGATPHSEPLAMLLSLACLSAYLRGSLGWSVAWLSIAALARFPAILLGAPLALGVLWLRGDRRFSRWVLLAIPLVCFALYNLYLTLRIPDFGGILGAHAVWWDTGWTWPFAEILTHAASLDRSAVLPTAQVTFALLLVYLAALGLGFWRRPREHWILPLWVAPILLFHVSLTGQVGAADFARLAVLAWPAALLVVWSSACRGFEPRLPSRVARGAALAISLVAAAISFTLATRQIGLAVYGQRSSQAYLEQAMARLDDDEPHWVDFEAFAREAARNPRRRPRPRPQSP